MTTDKQRIAKELAERIRKECIELDMGGYENYSETKAASSRENLPIHEGTLN